MIETQLPLVIAAPDVGVALDGQGQGVVGSGSEPADYLLLEVENFARAVKRFLLVQRQTQLAVGVAAPRIHAVVRGQG